MTGTIEQKESGRKLFYGLFLFPLLIAVGMAILLCTVVLLTREAETPESLITAIKTGTPSKRWQKAYELSNELNQGRGLLRSSGVMKEVIHILTSRSEYDPKTRSYMAVALSRFDEPEVIPALQNALSQEKDIDVQLFLLWALGVKEARAAEAQIRDFLKSEDPHIRKMAAYVLGAVGSDASADALIALLDDRHQDVRWNAALSLARLGRPEGYEELLQMIDRISLDASGGLTEEQKEEIMTSAVKGIALLGRKDAVPLIRQLAGEDPSLKVRQAAMQSLNQLTESKAV